MTRNRSRVPLLAVLALCGSLLVTNPVTARPAEAAGTHPRLLLTAADLPTLRARTASGEGARAWATLQERLTDYTSSPTVSPYYLDPSLVGVRNSDGTLKNYADQNEMPGMLIDLSFGYLITGNPGYADLVIRTLEALGDAHWPFWSDTSQYLGGGDLLRGVALAYDWTYPAMTPAQRDDIVVKLRQPMTVGQLAGRPLLDLAVIAGNAAAPGSNWSAVDGGGAGLALLALQGEPSAPSYLTSYLSTAQSRVGAYLTNALGKDGEGGEGYTYLGYGLHGALPFAIALKDSGGTDLVTASPGVAHIAGYLASMLIPSAGYDGTVPLNDSDRDALADELIELLWKVTPDTGLVSSVWEHTLGPAAINRYATGRTPPYLPSHTCTDATTNSGTYLLGCGFSNAEEFNLLYNQHASTPAADPATSLTGAQHFDDHGLVTARTGWDGGSGDVLATFSASRGAAGHTQEDIGQFTLYGYGGDFAIDSGYGHNYSCSAVLAAAKQCDPTDSTTPDGQSVGHNLMLVDDNVRTQHGARTNATTETIPQFVDAKQLAFAHASTATQFPTDPPLVGRDWLFTHAAGRPVVLAIGDQLQRDGAAHSYNLQLHTSALNAVNLRGNGFSVVAPSGAVMSGLAARNGDLLQSTRSAFEAQPFTGNAFDRPNGHILLLQLDPTTHQTVDELTVLALSPAGAVPPSVSRLEVPGTDTIEVSAGGVGQVVIQSLAGAGTGSALGFTLDGAFGTALQGAGEALLRNGTRLTAYGKDYVVVTGSAATVAVSGAGVQATGPSGNSYTVFAPQPVTSVTVNGTAVTSCRTGDYLAFPC